MDRVTVEQLRAELHYDPETGVFTRLKKTQCGGQIGSVAGGITSGRWRISVDGERHDAHILAWLYVHGVWPDSEIDHKDRNPTNNRISNLRTVTSSQNKHNQIDARAHNKNTGVRGVERCGDSYRARVAINGVRHHLGMFSTIEAASQAYDDAKKQRGLQPWLIQA